MALQNQYWSLKMYAIIEALVPIDASRIDATSLTLVFPVDGDRIARSPGIVLTEITRCS